jgi:hypothetical protein
MWVPTARKDGVRPAIIVVGLSALLWAVIIGIAVGVWFAL